MVFNTGAALLDAMYWPLCRKRKRVLTDTASPRMSEKRSMSQNRRCIRCFAGF